VLTLSPVHAQLYQAAAESLIDEALQPGGSRSQLLAPGLGQFVLGTGASLRPDAIALTGGEARVSLSMPAVGTYQVTVTAYGEIGQPADNTIPPPPGLTDPPQLGVPING